MPDSHAVPPSRPHHWDTVYTAKRPSEVSWYEPDAAVSAGLVLPVTPAGGRVIDVGGGASVLVDRLLEAGLDVTVLDVSAAGLDRAKARLGDRAGRVRWIVADVTAAPDLGTFDTWHDRAAFHFLTSPEDRRAYAAAAARTVRPGGHAIVGTFAPDGPSRCSGLDVCRYDAAGIASELGPAFALIDERRHTHLTPAGKPQQFQFCVLRRVGG